MRDAYLRIEAQVISRGAGHSLVAAAAYRLGVPLYDERTGTRYRFPTRDRIDHVETLAPESAPDWVQDPQRLNNSIEASERRRDAQLARELVISLPHELTHKQGLKAVKAFAERAFVREGYVVQLASHGYKRDPRSGRRSWHLHLWVSLRRLVDGQWESVKDRALNLKYQLYAWRQQIADRVNEELWSAGHNAQVHALSAEKRGLEAPDDTRTPFEIWHRDQRLTPAALIAVPDAAIPEPITPQPASAVEPANDTGLPADGADRRGLSGLFSQARKWVVDTGLELSLAASSARNARLEDQERKRREAAEAERVRKQIEAAKQERIAEQQARREFNMELARLRQVMAEKAGGRAPLVAFMRTWNEEADRAMSDGAMTVEAFGKAADRAGMRALVEAGGDRLDVKDAAEMSPMSNRIRDPLARITHVGGLISFASKIPAMEERDNAAQLEAARQAHFPHLVPHRPRPKLVEADRAAAPTPREIGRAREWEPEMER
jgi:hypothetical protein